MNFRTTLREATRADHDRLDDVISSFDLAKRAGFATFANIHLICFEKMQRVCAPDSTSRQLLGQMVRALRADVATLGAEQSDATAKLPPSLDPLAIDYMVAGSRLGSHVLRQRWLTSSDNVVRNSDRYFSLHSDPAFWQLTCAALADIPVDSARAETIIKDTRTVFTLFLTVTQHTLAPEAAVQ